MDLALVSPVGVTGDLNRGAQTAVRPTSADGNSDWTKHEKNDLTWTVLLIHFPTNGGNTEQNGSFQAQFLKLCCSIDISDIF